MEIRATEAFGAWIAALKDDMGRGKIVARIERMRVGNFGDSKPVGGGVSELRIGGKGPGYRVYYTVQGNEVVILLCAGDKSSQKFDIEQAQAIAATL